MNKYIIAIIIAIAISTLPTLTCAAPLTLDQCIQHGLSHNLEIKAYQFSVDESQQGVNEAIGAFLPTFTVSYNTTQLSNGSSSERDTDYLDQQSDSLSCKISQPLFTGFSGLSGLKKAKYSRQYKQLEFESIQQRLIRDVKTNYYNIVMYRQLIVKWQNSVKRLRSQREIAVAWYDQRLAPMLRVLEVEVELSNAQQQLIVAETNLAISREQLGELLALDNIEKFDIDYDNAILDIERLNPLTSYLDKAVTQRPELQMSALNVDIARQDAKTILARNLPRADFDASWVDYQREYDVSSYAADDRDYFNISLNVSIRPFQGGRNISAWRRQRIAVDRLSQNSLKQKRTVVTEVKIRYKQLLEGVSRLSVARGSLNRAQEAYSVATKSLQLGVNSLNDLLDAELLLTRAEIDSINVHNLLQLAQVNLDFSAGIK